jgi:hypothetical protein
LEIINGHLVYFEVIWNTFPRFGILDQEKSGNPDVEMKEGLSDKTVTGHSPPEWRREEIKTGQWQGCQIFLDTIYQNERKYTKLPQHFPNGHKIHQMTLKYSKRPENILAFSILRPSKSYPNWDFWFKNEPSGNPGQWRGAGSIRRLTFCALPARLLFYRKTNLLIT